jgi:hypothetical protein
MTSLDANITLGTLDLTSKIINVGNLNLKLDSEIEFSYSTPTYADPDNNYSVTVALEEPGHPLVAFEVLQGKGGIITINDDQMLNVTILVTNWDQIGTAGNLQITLGVDPPQNVTYGQSSVVFNNVVGDTADFSIIINNEFGANSVKALSPLIINRSAPSAVSSTSSPA